MSDTTCVINAKSGIGTSSPQITQFTHNCDCVKFIIDKDFTNCAVVVITSIEGQVSVVSEGDSLKKTYDATTKETTLLWYPTSEITCLSGCVIYQVAAYNAETKDTIWYSKEGRLIVNDSIETTDYSTKVVGSAPDLVMQILTLSKETELKVLSLSDSKVDKQEGKMLSSNDFTDEDKLSIQENAGNISVLNDELNVSRLRLDISDNNISQNSGRIDELEAENNFRISEIAILQTKAEENKGEAVYDAKSEKAQSGKAVAQAIASIVNSAPETLNTLEELARALGNDPNFASTIMTLLGKKLDNTSFEKEADLLKESLNKKVDKEDGKGLSSNDFTDDNKADLSAVVKLAENLEENKADKATTLSGYGITNVYTKAEVLGVLSNQIEPHTSNTANPHSVTKAQVGLGNADNTSDMDKPVSKAMQEALDKKVNIEDYTSDLDTTIYELDNIKADIKSNADDIAALEEELYQAPITEIPPTLEANKEYNFGGCTELSLIFPTTASDGDVIYITFKSGETATTLTIDTTNTCDIEVIPEINTGYELFGKYNGSIWIVNYSEYIVSEG